MLCRLWKGLFYIYIKEFDNSTLQYNSNASYVKPSMPNFGIPTRNSFLSHNKSGYCYTHTESLCCCTTYGIRFLKKKYLHNKLRLWENFCIFYWLFRPIFIEKKMSNVITNTFQHFMTNVKANGDTIETIKRKWPFAVLKSRFMFSR